MSDYGITLGYEKDKCSICGYTKEIRIIYSKKDKKIAKVCDACVNEQGHKTPKELIGEFGEKTTEKQIQILTKEQLEKSGFKLTGKKKN